MSKILLVEDNDSNLDMLSRRLVYLGYQVVAARDGEEGIAVAVVELPDLILMDIGLPVIDGLEATRRLKSNEATQAIPIIALTAHAMQGDREAAFAAGCDDYDTKPVNLERLTSKIDSLLKERVSS